MNSIAVTTREQADAWAESVLADGALSLGAKVTAMALRGHLNFTTLRLDPSAARLAAVTVQGERSVQRHLKELSDGGLIAWEGTNGRTSNKYRLTLTPTLASGLDNANPDTGDVVAQNNPDAGDVVGQPTPPNGAANPDTGDVQTPVEPLKKELPSGVHSRGLKALMTSGHQNHLPVSKAEPATKGRRWGADERVPVGWPHDAAQACLNAGLEPPDMAIEVTKFENYWPSCAGAKGVKLDWRKTFINWIIRSAEDGKNRAVKTGRGKSTATDQHLAGIFDLAGDLRRRRAGGPH